MGGGGSISTHFMFPTEQIYYLALRKKINLAAVFNVSNPQINLQ
jgi:hypothetical protein